MKAYIRVFKKSDGLTIDGWEEVIAFWSDENPILPLEGDGYRVNGHIECKVTKIEHGYLQRTVDQGGVFDNILIYVE